MTITGILLQYHLQISLIDRINPFSGCSHCLEASQVVYDTNRLTGFFVMRISFEGSYRAICKTIFFVNRILLLLSVLLLALIFLIFMAYLVFSMLHCFSTLVCANIVGRFACFDLGSKFIDAVFIGLYGGFNHYFVDLKDTCFQRWGLIWSNIVEWEFSTANILFSIWSIKFSLC